MSFTAIRQALKTAKKIKKTIDSELKEGLIPTPKEAKGKNVQNTTQAKARSNKLAKDIKDMEGILKGPDSKAATQKGLRFAKKYEVQEGMGLDAITGGSIRAAVDVDKGKAGKVTRSPEPGFLQQQRTEGGRKAGKRKAELQRKVDDGKATVSEKRELRALRKADKRATESATAKGAASRVKPDSKRGRAVQPPELKSIPKKEAPAKGAPINIKTGEINEAVFNKLTPPQQQAAIRNAVARAEGPVSRRIKAQLDELMLKEGRGKAGETGVGARSGGPRGMRGATERNIKDIDEGVSRGRGGLDFRKGGAVKKKAIGATDYRMNKGGLLLSSVDNRKKK